VGAGYVSSHGYSEESIVEEPAIALFAEKGWRTTSAMEEKFGAGVTLGRETSGERRSYHGCARRSRS
jgi:type I restriction enzyme R subunit